DLGPPGCDRRAARIGGVDPMSTFLIACGGTGGHLSPGIALAQRLRRRGHDAVLLISEKPIDRQLATKYPEFRFESIAGAPFAVQPAALSRFVAQQVRGLRQSLELIRREQPAA